jgi:hypothetical protein
MNFILFDFLWKLGSPNGGSNETKNLSRSLSDRKPVPFGSNFLHLDLKSSNSEGLILDYSALALSSKASRMIAIKRLSMIKVKIN